MPATYTLYGSFLSAPTYRVGLMLRLSGLGFDYRHVDLSKGDHKTADFLKLNRFGQVPVLVHGGLSLCQSGAILEYLAEQAGKFAPATPEERQRIREWLFWDADRLAPGVGRTRFFERFAKQDAAVMDYMRKNGEAGLGVLNAQLEGKRFLVGERPTIADIGVFGTLAHMAEGKFEVANWPSVRTWWDRISALPGFQPPYDLLPKHDKQAA